MHGYVQLPDRFKKQRQQQQKLQHCHSVLGSHTCSTSVSLERSASLQPWKPAGSISLHATGTTDSHSNCGALHQAQLSHSRPPSPRVQRSSCSSEGSNCLYSNKENAVRSSRIFKSRETKGGALSRPQSRADCNTSSTGSVDLRPALQALKDGCNTRQLSGAATGANRVTTAGARPRATAQQGSYNTSSIFRPHEAVRSSRSSNSHPLVATSTFSVRAILAGTGSDLSNSSSSAVGAAAATEAGSRAMLWQPLACNPLSSLSGQQSSPWRQVTPDLSPAAMRYAHQHCSPSSSEQQPVSATSSSQSIRLRQTTPLERRQQQVQQQLRQSCQQLQELARLLSSPQQASMHDTSLLSEGYSSAGSASRHFAVGSNGCASSLSASQHTSSHPTATVALGAVASCSTSLCAALEAAETRCGLPADSDLGCGLGTLQQLASAINQAAAPSAACAVHSAADEPASHEAVASSCASSYSSIGTQCCTATPDECITPTPGTGTGIAARVFGDSPVEPISSPPPSLAQPAQAAHEPQLHLLHCGSPSADAAAASAAASYKELLDKCQVSENRG
jgi:hypothetical protein